MQMKSWILAGVLGATALGCGDDDGGGGSGVPGSKKINDLSEAELRSLCVSMGKKLEDVAEVAQKAACTLGGLVAESTDAGECAETRDACLEEDPEAEMLDCDEPAEEMMDDCDATVAEFEACVDAMLDAYEDWAGQITCSTELEELEDLQGSTPDEPAACARLDEACGLGGAFEDVE